MDILPNMNMKLIAPDDVYKTIEKCNSKKLKITYCSLTLNNKCMETKKIVILVNKINKNCGFIEGVILKNNEPVEDIILKSSQILSIECAGNNDSSENESVFETIKNCNGFIRITQCMKLEKGKCKESKTFPFLVTSIDEKNKNIKGYKIRNNMQPEYTVIDASVILKVDCLGTNNNPRSPFSIYKIPL